MKDVLPHMIQLRGGQVLEWGERWGPNSNILFELVGICEGN